MRSLRPYVLVLGFSSFAAACIGEVDPGLEVTSAVTGACDEQSCDAPPEDGCTEDGSARVFYDASGQCEEGRCRYGVQRETCDFGCRHGECLPEASSQCSDDAACATPPEPSCKDSKTRLSYEAAGACIAGQCVYDNSEEYCALGCVDGACQQDACAGVSCVAPPAAVCRDTQTLVKYAASGVCSEGACSYAPSEERCADGCEDGACIVPPCCGCLCRDSTWSCAASTCLDTQGVVSDLGREVGFLELSTAPLMFGEEQLERMRTRMWYAFFPADQAPADKPLLVFFNGGPGSATVLIGINTGPSSFFGPELTANANSWTRFANLLYIDPHDVGFSYSVEGGASFTPDQDAALYTRTLLAFLKRHPRLRDNRVGIVGESYGGVRATIMIEQILHSSAILSSPYYPSPELQDALIEHFAAVRGGDGMGLTPTQVAEQFAFQVLIQPAIGRYDYRKCPEEGRDLYQCDEEPGFTDSNVDYVASRLVTPSSWNVLWGADLRTVEWMLPRSRLQSQWRGSAAGPDETEMVAALGALNEGDRYYARFNALTDRLFARTWQNNDALVAQFADNTRFVRTLVTNAVQDGVVNSEAIPGFVKAAGAPVVDARYDVSPRSGVLRPGFMQIDFARAGGGVDTTEVRMPRYPKAGHMVSLRAASELADDVQALLQTP